MLISVCDRVENIVGKGENAGYQHFLLFPQCFQTTSFSESLRVELCGKELIIKEKIFENIAQKGDNAGELLFYFPRFFPPFKTHYLILGHRSIVCVCGGGGGGAKCFQFGQV